LFQLERNGLLKKLAVADELLNKNQKRTKRHVIVRSNRSFTANDTISMLSKKIQHQKSNQSKNRRQNLSLDLLVVTDHSIYDYFLKTHGHNDESALQALYKYYTSILLEVMVFFRILPE